MSTILSELESTIKDMVVSGRGILAADESTGTIKKRFDTIHVESTEENRRAYRELLFTTDGLERYVSGVILFEETLGQKTKEGVDFPTYLNEKGIVPGIKVDKGLIDCESSPQEKVTQGLDGLPDRLLEYKKMGARFAKWRAVFRVSAIFPSELATQTNAILLARYAAICQSLGIVPIVEPEVLMDGGHSLARCAEVTEHVLHVVFHALHQYKVELEHIILKPSMVISGQAYTPQPSIRDVAEETVKILRRTVPAAVPSINFLSGGQGDAVATAHLNEMNKLGPHPWHLSFSYGRALQAPALDAWRGDEKNADATQKALLTRAQFNSAATLGKYDAGMEYKRGDA